MSLRKRLMQDTLLGRVAPMGRGRDSEGQARTQGRDAHARMMCHLGHQGWELADSFTETVCEVIRDVFLTVQPGQEREKHLSIGSKPAPIKHLPLWDNHFPPSLGHTVWVVN